MESHFPLSLADVQARFGASVYAASFVVAGEAAF